MIYDFLEEIGFIPVSYCIIYRKDNIEIIFNNEINIDVYIDEIHTKYKIRNNNEVEKIQNGVLLEVLPNIYDELKHIYDTHIVHK
jgi:hypothetical protein